GQAMFGAGCAPWAQAQGSGRDYEFFVALGDNPDNNRISRGGNKSVSLINKKCWIILCYVLNKTDL
ncbi:hypothetical protein KA005_75255, partial [bacterium]|nr:hypothetical protein [bacterium]